MQPSTPDVVGAYWAHHRLSSGARAERLAAQDLFWARQEVADAMGGPLRRALQVLETRIADPDADLLAVGAGPLENLLTRTDVLPDGEVGAAAVAGRRHGARRRPGCGWTRRSSVVCRRPHRS